jgi:hypothetical protein
MLLLSLWGLMLLSKLELLSRSQWQLLLLLLLLSASQLELASESRQIARSISPRC